jgi:hypothetical protein
MSSFICEYFWNVRALPDGPKPNSHRGLEARISQASAFASTTGAGRLFKSTMWVLTI